MSDKKIIDGWGKREPEKQTLSAGSRAYLHTYAVTRDTYLMNSYRVYFNTTSHDPPVEKMPTYIG